MQQLLQHKLFLLGGLHFNERALEQILASLKALNLDALIAEAERILAEIKSRNFGPNERGANTEFTLAKESE